MGIRRVGRVRWLAATAGIACTGALALPSISAAGELSVWLPAPIRDPDGPAVMYDVRTRGVDDGANDRVTVELRRHWVAGIQGETALVDANGTAILPDPDDLQETLTHCAFAAVKAACTGLIHADLWLGAGNDVGQVTSPAVIGFGGNIVGGAGHDILRGGTGDDSLWGDAGAKSRGPSGGPIEPVTPGADRFIGGGGHDQARYADSHPGPLTVTLDDQANDGVPGEGDNVRSDVESVLGHTSGGTDTLIGNAADNLLSGSGVLRGSDGDDRLIGHGDGLLDGGPGADHLSTGFSSTAESYVAGPGDDLVADGGGVGTIDAGPGIDRILARGGDDDIDPGPGADSEVDASAGDDLIRARDGERDWIQCGAGTDTVQADPIDQLEACEIVETA